MAINNVTTGAKIVKQKDEGVVPYQLGSFIGNMSEPEIPNFQRAGNAVLHSQNDMGTSSKSNADLSMIIEELNNIKTKIDNIESNGVGSKELDKQVVTAIKELKQYASFFEQATFALEAKILKTSMSIAKKIISIELGENSSKIAKETINNILAKIKTASKITIHLNPKDYAVLKHDLQLQPFIVLNEDPNVTAGGVVIASDLGNFDGNIDAKITSMVETLDSIV
jgi:flagellar assembly protein FliH